jgi:catechol 2,3-dioxygenase-like lactoylglutathione lyase family enzyme
MKFQKLTPNLVVRDVAASMEFYRSVLGFQTAITVPERPPYVFGSVTGGLSRDLLQRPKSCRRRLPRTRRETHRRQPYVVH